MCRHCAALDFVFAGKAAFGWGVLPAALKRDGFGYTIGARKRQKPGVTRARIIGLDGLGELNFRHKKNHRKTTYLK